MRRREFIAGIGSAATWPVTGVVLRAGAESTAKLVELVHDLLPATTTIGMLVDPKFLETGPDTAAVQAAVTSFGQKAVIAEATVEADLEPAMTKLVQAHVGALLIGDNLFFSSLRGRIAHLAMRNNLPILAVLHLLTRVLLQAMARAISMAYDREEFIWAAF